MFSGNDMGGRKNTLNVYMLLAECLKVVKKMCMAWLKAMRSELSTDAEFNVK